MSVEKGQENFRTKILLYMQGNLYTEIIKVSVMLICSNFLYGMIKIF